MKELVMFLWGALVASGWWAIAVFGAPSGQTDFGLMHAVVIFTALASICGSIIIATKIFEEW